ncbi:hypothetical protein HYT04_01830 [Candidatus Kaiserbacteria bacterium]|nr:hypothetical protein [Candidatus Kaiserbacteria bacterium]
MSWAARRRFVILLIIGAVVGAFISVIGIATFYKAPSCTDGARNQAEDGVDCGGPCAYLCTELKQAPTVLFTKAIQNGDGRVDVIAKVENKNADAAAKNVPYTITLYGSDQSLIQEVSGTLDLPPGTSVPVFAPGVPSGKQTVVNAFLEIAQSSQRWFYISTDPRSMPIVSNIRQTGTMASPRIEAVLLNPSAVALTNVKAIVLVHNDTGDVIAASSTIVPSIPAQGQAAATFTWNGAFPDVPASVEVVPIIPLP